MLIVLATWWAFLWLLALLGWPLARRWLPGASDAGWGTARLVALLVWGYGPFLVASLGGTLDRRLLVVALVGLAAGSATLAFRDRAQLRTALRTHAGDIAVAELLFVMGLLAFTTIAVHTDTGIFGERAMDLAILGEAAVATQLPPPNPYFAGSSLNYYYYGHYLFGSVARLLNIDPVSAYLPAVGTIAALTLSAGFSLLGRIATGWVGALFAFPCVFLSTNLGVLRAADRSAGFFSSNWLVGDALTEYPLYTLVVAELHAHAMAMPILLVAVALALELTARLDEGVKSIAPTVVGLVVVLGALGPTSTWAWGSAAVALLTLAGGAGFAANAGRGALRFLGIATVVLGLSLAAYWPFYARLAGEFALRLNGAISSEPIGFALHWGPLFVLAGLAAALRWAAAGDERRALIRAGRVGLGLTVLLLALRSIPLTSLGRLAPTAVALILIGLALGAAWRDRGDFKARSSWLLIAAGTALVVGAESVHLADAHPDAPGRVTTVFKLSLHAWLLIGLGAGAAVSRIWQARTILGHALALAVLGWLGVGAVFTLAGVRTKTEGFRRGPQLSAIAFQSRRDPGYSAVLEHLRLETRRGVCAVVAEWVEPDRNTNWLSVVPGVRAYVAWPEQLVQWAYPSGELRARIATLESLYRASDAIDACALSRVEGIDLVFFGQVERRRLGAAAEDLFRAPPFEEVFRLKGSALYSCGPLVEPS